MFFFILEPVCDDQGHSIETVKNLLTRQLHKIMKTSTIHCTVAYDSILSILVKRGKGFSKQQDMHLVACVCPSVTECVCVCQRSHSFHTAGYYQSEKCVGACN